MTTKKETLDKEKLKLGLYKVTFKSELDTGKRERIELTVNITRDLKYLLHNFIASKEMISEVILGTKYKRYKYKAKLLGSLNGWGGNIIFAKELVEKEQITLMVESIETLEELIKVFKRGFKYLIETLLMGTQRTEITYKE